MTVLEAVDIPLPRPVCSKCLKNFAAVNRKKCNACLKIAREAMDRHRAVKREASRTRSVAVQRAFSELRSNHADEYELIYQKHLRALRPNAGDDGRYRRGRR